MYNAKAFVNCELRTVAVSKKYTIPHIGKMHVHRIATGEILNHAFHETAEAAIAQRFIVENHEQRCDQIAHALHVANFQMLPYITAIQTNKRECLDQIS